MNEQLLQAITAKMTHADLHEITVRFTLNVLVQNLRLEGVRVTQQALRGPLPQLAGDPTFELLLPQYVAGGWNDQIHFGGMIVALTQPEVIQLRDDLHNLTQDDHEVIKDEEDPADRQQILDAIEIRNALMSKTAV